MAETKLRLTDLSTKTALTSSMSIPLMDSSDNVDYRITADNLKSSIISDVSDEVKGNARTFHADRMTDYDVTPAQMIVGWVPDAMGGGAYAGEIILRNNSSNKYDNGLWVIQATGAATRYSKCDTAETLGRSIVYVRYGTFGNNEYKCTYNDQILNNPITYVQRYNSNQETNTTSTVTFANITDSGLTLNELVATNSTKQLVSLAVATYPSLTELAYVKGLNQTLTSTSSPTFNALTTNGLATLNNAKIGDVVGGNYIEMETDGNITLHGTAKIKGYVEIAFASIYLADGNTAQSIPTGTTYTKVTAYTNNGLYSNCTADATNDKITITEVGVYKVNYTASYTSGTNNVTFRGAVFAGGVEQPNIHSGGQMGLAGAMRSTSCCGFVYITSVPTDVDVRIRHDNGGSVDITHVYANLNVEKIG